MQSKGIVSCLHLCTTQSIEGNLELHEESDISALFFTEWRSWRFMHIFNPWSNPETTRNLRRPIDLAEMRPELLLFTGCLGS